jgi:hypothetical protein
MGGTFVRIAGCMVCLALFWPSAVEAAEQKTPHDPRYSVCTTIYKPVCARTPAGQFKTFSNECLAKRERADLAWFSVCGRAPDGQIKTYDDRCRAMEASADILANAACRRRF